MTKTAVFFSIFAVAAIADAAPKKPPEPALPAPEVKLEVDVGATGKMWSMRVTNNGSTPLKLVADARLLRFEVEPLPDTTPPPKKGAKKKQGPKTFTCELPGSMRSDGRTLELAPGASYLEIFDPRLFCLDRTKELVAGVKIKPALGWRAPKKGKLGKPFVVEPTKEGEVAAAKEIAGAELLLDTDVLPSPAQGKPMKDLTAKAGGARSVFAGSGVDTTIVVKNEGTVARTLYARPQLVDARVRNPRGVITTCGGPPITPAPVIDFVTKLPKNGTWSATVTLDNFCPQGTFDVPGLYLVMPVVHLPPIPDQADAVVGDLSAAAPQLLRVETGKKPFHDVPPAAAK
ncbi:MAG: hypothetical protein ACXVEF_42150 [Polyangiales bacterium]